MFVIIISSPYMYHLRSRQSKRKKEERKKEHKKKYSGGGSEKLPSCRGAEREEG